VVRSRNRYLEDYTNPNFIPFHFGESPDALIGLGTVGTVVLGNRGAQGIFGSTAEEAVGKGIYALVVLEDRVANETQLLPEGNEKGFSGYFGGNSETVDPVIYGN
jgi:PAS domain-containing protein